MFTLVDINYRLPADIRNVFTHVSLLQCRKAALPAPRLNTVNRSLFPVP